MNIPTFGERKNRKKARAFAAAPSIDLSEEVSLYSCLSIQPQQVFIKTCCFLLVWDFYMDSLLAFLASIMRMIKSELITEKVRRADGRMDGLFEIRGILHKGSKSKMILEWIFPMKNGWEYIPFVREWMQF